jgi:hypothetical protein
MKNSASPRLFRPLEACGRFLIGFGLCFFLALLLNILTRAKRFANSLMKDYKDVQIVKDFYEEMNTTGETQ